MENYLKPMTDGKMEELIKKHNKGGAFAKQIAAANTCWDAGIKIIKTCGHMTVPKYKVEFEVLADEKIKKLQDYYPTLEWLAYLEGEVNHEQKHVLVTDIIIPDSQEVTGVNVYNVEYGWSDGRKIIGVIHSHHTMGAFFSGTDDAYINQNHDVSIVVSTNPSSPIKGQVRMKTLCGSYILAEDLTFSVKHKKVLDEDAFEKEFTSKINSNRPVYVNHFSDIDSSISKDVVTRHLHPVTGLYYTPKMEKELRTSLSKYYSDDDITELIEDGTADQELHLLQQMEEEQTMVMTDEEWEEEEWESIEDTTKNEVENWTTEDEESGTGGQTGYHQVSYGIDIKIDTDDNDDSICDLTEEEIVEKEPVNIRIIH